MKTRLFKLVFYTAFSFVIARAFPQSAIPSPQITIAACGAAVCTWNAFGPKTFTRQTGKPQTVSSTFGVLFAQQRVSLPSVQQFWIQRKSGAGNQQKGFCAGREVFVQNAV